MCISSKYGWSKASLALIRFYGLKTNIFYSKSTASFEASGKSTAKSFGSVFFIFYKKSLSP